MSKLEALQTRIPIGYRTEKLTVIGYERYGKPPYYWLVKCHCDCGKIISERPYRFSQVRKIKSCGCSAPDYYMQRFIEKYPLESKFGELTVIGHESVKLGERARNGSRFQRRLVCRCSCGHSTKVLPKSVVGMDRVSCGHLGRKLRIEASRAAWKLPDGVASLHAVFGRAKVQAHWRKIEWNLEISDFETLSRMPCHYCGSPPDKAYCAGRSKIPFIYSGIDRSDCQRPYSKENCVPACKVCNYAKRTLSTGEFAAWVRKIATHWLHMV